MGITKMIRAIGKRKTAPDKTGTGIAGGVGRVALDHPQQGEKITSPQYTFRVGALGDIERVEISINQGPWQVCRYSVGYWWYDWSGYAGGRYQAMARAQTKNGQVVSSAARKFQVAFGTEEKQR